ncbi:MAG: autotransporter outer membrane beta-barrel domain-containing protein [Thermoguttaceae bacterium]|nr:autotransporter outer membrane beta-barrel domain-containing protein [Thermoguttaceae bacterium]
MESKQKKQRRRARKQLAAFLSAVLATSFASSVFADVVEVADWTSLNTALSQTTSSELSLAGNIDLASGNPSVGASHTIDLKGNQLTQNGNGFVFSSAGQTLTIKDSNQGESGSQLDFTSFGASGSAAGTVKFNGLSQTFANGLTLAGQNLTLDDASVITVVGTMNSGSSLLKLNAASSMAADTLNGAHFELDGASQLQGTTVNAENGFTLSVKGASYFSAAQDTEADDPSATGILTVVTKTGDTVTVDAAGAASTSEQSAFVVGTKTSLAVKDDFTFSVLNGAYASLADLSLTVESGKTADFIIDGSQTFTAQADDGNESSQSMNSTLVLKSLESSGKLNFKLQNGGSLYLENGDLTLDEENDVQITKDLNAKAASVLSVGGTLSVDKDFSVGTGTDSNVSQLYADKLILAPNADSSVDFAVKDGQSAQAGVIQAALNNGASLSVMLSGGAQLGAFADENNDAWKGEMTLGAENGGNVSIDLAEGSILMANQAMNITLQDGDSISLDDKAQIYVGGISEGGYTNVQSGENLSINTVGDAFISVTKTSQIYSVGITEFKAAAGAELTVVASGEDASNPTLLSSEDGTFIGGAGSVIFNVGDNSVVGSCQNMTIGDTEGGYVDFTIAGKGSYVYVGNPNDHSDSTIGNLTIAEHGTVNMTVDNSSAINAGTSMTIAKEEDAIANVNLADGGTLNSVGDMIIGDKGTAIVDGEGSLIAGGQITVGQSEDNGSSVSLRNGTVETTGLIVGAAEDTDAEFSLSGNKSLFHLLAPAEGAKETVGYGSVNLDGLKSEDMSSCVYFEKGSQLIAHGGISFNDSDVYLNSDTTLASNGGIRFSGARVYDYNGSLNANGDVSFKDSTYYLGIGTDGSANTIKVNDGSLSIENSKLEVYFTGYGNISGTEWNIAQVESDDENDKIYGEWEINSPMEVYTFDQSLSEDGKKLTLTTTLKQEYFNGRANTLQLARQSLWNTVDDRINWNADGRAYCGYKSPNWNYEERSAFWMKSGYHGLDVKGNNGYDINAFALTLGADCAFEEYFAAGAFFSFSSPEMEEDYETADANNYSFGVYAGYKTFADLEIRGTLAYTLSKYDMTRVMGEAGFATSSFYGSGLTVSAEIAKPFYFGNFVVRPLFAIDSEIIWQEEAMESGAYAMYYDKTDDSWTYARSGAKIDYSVTDQLTLRAKAFYAMQLDDQGATKTTARFVGDSKAEQFTGKFVGDDYFNIGVSAAYMFTHNFSVFADYNGFFNSESTSTYVNGGFQINF